MSHPSERRLMSAILHNGVIVQESKECAITDRYVT